MGYHCGRQGLCAGRWAVDTRGCRDHAHGTDDSQPLHTEVLSAHTLPGSYVFRGAMGEGVVICHEVVDKSGGVSAKWQAAQRLTTVVHTRILLHACPLYRLRHRIVLAGQCPCVGCPVGPRQLHVK